MAKKHGQGNGDKETRSEAIAHDHLAEGARNRSLLADKTRGHEMNAQQRADHHRRMEAAGFKVGKHALHASPVRQPPRTQKGFLHRLIPGG